MVKFEHAKPASPSPNMTGYDLSLIYRLKVMFAAFWASEVRNRILVLSGLLLTVIIATAFGQVILNRWNAPFYDSLERRNFQSFMHQLQIFGLIAGVLLLLNVLQAWLNQMAALYMREGLSRDLFSQWLTRKRGFRLMSGGLIGTNPDQRLHEDARHLAESTTGLTIGLLQATILLVSFTGVLWELSRGFVFSVSGHHFSIPGYMVWAAILYAGSASILSRLVGRKLVAINAEKSSKEADLRFSLMHANENMASITLANGEKNECRHINIDLTAVLAVTRRMAMANTNLTWVSAGYGWLVIVFPILIAAPAYFTGTLTFGQLMMSVGAFNQVNTALRWYVANFGPIAEWKATLIRVTDFRQALQDMDASASAKDGICFQETEENRFELKKLVIFAQAAKEELRDEFFLSQSEVTLDPGEKILFATDNGRHRRLMFQTLAGLWHYGTGTISAPSNDILFIPQTGYLADGALRETLAFPQDVNAYTHEMMCQALDKTGLSHLKERLDTRARWDKLLDANERKALAFAHLLLMKPKWAVFEGVFENMEPDIKIKLARTLKDLPDTGMIYVGQSETYIKMLQPKIVRLETNSEMDEVKQVPTRQKALSAFDGLLAKILQK